MHYTPLTEKNAINSLTVSRKPMAATKSGFSGFLSYFIQNRYYVFIKTFYFGGIFG